MTQHTLLWPEKKWWMTVLTRIWLVCNSPHNYVTSKPYIKILTHYGSQTAELERKGEHKWMHFLLHFVHPHTISVKPPLIYTANLWGKVHSQFRNNAIVAVLWGLALRKLRNKNRVRSWKKKLACYPTLHIHNGLCNRTIVNTLMRKFATYKLRSPITPSRSSQFPLTSHA